VYRQTGARGRLAPGGLLTRRAKEYNPRRYGAKAYSFQGENLLMAEVEIGKVAHYFSKVGVAAIQITREVLCVGDTIHVKGHTSDFTQKIDSMQIENTAVVEAVVGQTIGLRVAEHAREHDLVFKVVA
jgi:hypothetical protein